MPSVSPFKASRATQEYVEQFSASAYDAAVQNEDFTGQSQSDVSYLRILKPANFSSEQLTTEQCHEIARNRFRELHNLGVLVHDAADSLYIYRQMKDNHVYTGVIGLVAVEDYRNGHVKKHEKTRTVREKDMGAYFNSVRLNGSPVLLTYEDSAELNLLIEQAVEAKPEYHFVTRAHTEHTLWRIEDRKLIEAIQKQFAGVKDFYIADGHHRCAAFGEIPDNPPAGFMACLIPATQLYIQSFYRLLKDLNGVDKNTLLDRLSKVFRVEKLEYHCAPASPGVIHLMLKEECYSLHIPEQMKTGDDIRAQLDVSILENEVFKNILGITDTRTSEKIIFVNGSEKTEKIGAMLSEGNIQAAFALYPLSTKDVIRISDIGETMPPKSTWIEPKLRSGLVIHSF